MLRVFAILGEYVTNQHVLVWQSLDNSERFALVFPSEGSCLASLDLLERVLDEEFMQSIETEPLWL